MRSACVKRWPSLVIPSVRQLGHVTEAFPAGARGVSVLFSSGDFGVGDGNPDPKTQQCLTNDGHDTTRFIPTFPASCP